MDSDKQEQLSREAIQLLAERCPRLAKTCYWAGTAAIAIEELHHRKSFDLDFHTRKALYDVRPLLAEIRAAFPGAFEIVQSPNSRMTSRHTTMYPSTMPGKPVTSC